jgi:hypothetical protein
MQVKRVMTLLIAAGLVLAVGLPATALAQLHIEEVARLRTDLVDDPVEVRGTVNCDPGDTYTLRLTVRQSTGQGTNTYEFTCESGPDSFSLLVYADEGFFTTGRAQVSARLLTSGGDSTSVRKKVRVEETLL